MNDARPIDANLLIKSAQVFEEYIEGQNVVFKFVDIKDVENAPILDAVPVVHGRWIEGKSLEKCSICGKKGFSDWIYCPRCGAKMDGVQK